MRFSSESVCRSVCSITLLAGVAGTALAEVPPPPNDAPGAAEVIGALPAIVVGSNVNGDDTISATTIAGLGSVPGPDVFYSFTPASTTTYWIAMIPWQQVPAYASGGATVPVPNLCFYVRRVDNGTFIGGAEENPRGRVEAQPFVLTAGVTYEIVVDSVESVPRGQEFEFTLMVAERDPGTFEDCATPGVLPAGLPTAVFGSLNGAADDFTYVDGTGRCDIAIEPFIAGIDHVHTFTTGPTPDAAGDYVFQLVPAGTQNWDGYLYVADSCPPFFPVGCLGSANHSNSSARQSEALVVTLDFDTTYYIVVEANSGFIPDGEYVLMVDRASAYGINEVEGNDTPGSATPLDPAALNGGQILGETDVDYWSLAAAAGDRVFLMLDHGNTALSGLDMELRLLSTDGATLIEFDDDDGAGSDSPVATLVQRQSAFSSTIAGATLPAAGTYFIEVASAGTETIARYFLHHGVQPAGRAPAAECEGNDSPGLADESGKNYFAGTVDPQGDVDSYAFDATAGDRVYIALDGDPERNSGGSDEDSVLALDAALVVLDPDGDVLISDHDDLNQVTGGQEPDYPAEGLYFVAPAPGRYVVQVAGGDPATDFGPGRTYQLAVFLNDDAPALSEHTDPEIDSLTPDFGADTIAVEASDDAAGDSGICDVRLTAGSSNIELLNVSFTPGDGQVAFDIGLIDPGMSGSGKLIIEDCAGNTACAAVAIDAGQPACSGENLVSPRRTFTSTHPPILAPDNEPSGPGIDGTIEITEGGTIQDVDVTVTLEGSRVLDMDVFLESPSGDRVELFTDRGGSSAFDVIDARFDDERGTEILSLLSSQEPYTGLWLPEDLVGLSRLDGDPVQGVWKLNLVDDASSSTGGSRLVRWSVDIDAGFDNPEYFEGQTSDTGGIQSVELVAPDNVQLNLDPNFTPGDTLVAYTVTLVDPSQGGSATLLVTDISTNTCSTAITLVGLPDVDAPDNSGSTTRNIAFDVEAQLDVPAADPTGVTSSFTVPQSVVVGAVVVDLTINTLDIGRLAATLSHDGEFASLINRVGMDERGSVGRTKDNIEITLDDDAPLEDDAHLEPALGSIPFVGLHQPDGRGEFIGDGIDTDRRDNMLFVFEGQDSAGQWDLYAADFREQISSTIRSAFRRWSGTIIAPGGPERYVGRARDVFPGAGICALTLSGASNLQVLASFTPGAGDVTYTVELVDPALPGSGTLEIEDCAGNFTPVAISLDPQTADQSLPVVSGGVNPATAEFEGAASDDGPDDSGIAAVELAPWADNLVLLSVTPTPPAGDVTFVIGLDDPNSNGRGYVRVTDATGFRRHLLVEIDAHGPVCTGTVGNTKRYADADDLPQDIPDNSAGGVSSVITVPDFDTVTDVDITLNIIHTFDDDIEVTLTSPVVIPLFSDIGSTGNDFIDTTLDDEAAEPLPDSFAAAPFTGRFQPEPPAMLSLLDGGPAAGSYVLQVVDDAVNNEGTFVSWALTITADTFPPRYDGRAEDARRHDGGICSLELLPGSDNLVLTPDLFAPGAAIVRYSVELANPAFGGKGVVRVTDCNGNSCDTVVCLPGAPAGQAGDIDGDGDVDLDDLLLLLGDFGCLEGCIGDADGDCDVDLDDLLTVLANFGS